MNAPRRPIAANNRFTGFFFDGPRKPVLTRRASRVKRRDEARKIQREKDEADLLERVRVHREKRCGALALIDHSEIEQVLREMDAIICRAPFNSAGFSALLERWRIAGLHQNPNREPDPQFPGYEFTTDFAALFHAIEILKEGSGVDGATRRQAVADAVRRVISLSQLAP